MVQLVTHGHLHVGRIMALVQVLVKVLHCMQAAAELDVDMGAVLHGEPWVVRHHISEMVQKINNETLGES